MEDWKLKYRSRLIKSSQIADFINSGKNIS